MIHAELRTAALASRVPNLPLERLKLGQNLLRQLRIWRLIRTAGHLMILCHPVMALLHVPISLMLGVVDHHLEYLRAERSSDASNYMYALRAHQLLRRKRWYLIIFIAMSVTMISVTVAMSTQGKPNPLQLIGGVGFLMVIVSEGSGSEIAGALHGLLRRTPPRIKQKRTVKLSFRSRVSA